MISLFLCVRVIVVSLANRCCMLLRCCSRPRVLPPGAPADRSDEAELPVDATCTRLRTSFAEEHSAGLFPMFAIRASEVMALKHMRSHEELKPRPWNPADGPLCFVSHQWTARDAPDHTGQQLAVLQHTLAHMHDLMTDPACNLAHAKPPIVPEDYSRLFVWLDYWSVPQSDARASERSSAIAAIPYYASNAAFMIILSPPVVHRTTGKLCDEQSWRSRGWCRLERLAFCLSRFSVMEPPRAYVVHAPSVYSRLANITIGSSKHSVFNGEFTYEADRERLVPVVRKVVECACAAREKQQELSSWRKLVALKNSFFSGSDEWESVAAAPPSVSAYLSKFAFTSANERGTHQMTCLHYAAFENNAAAVRMLIEAGAEVDARDTEAFPSGGGCTPLWFAVFHGCVEAAEALLQLRADVNRSASVTAPAPLLLVGGYAPVAETEKCLALLLGYGLDVNSPQCWDMKEGQYESSVVRLNGATLLSAAVYGGTAALVKMLLEAHADPLCSHEVAGGGRRTALDIARDEGKPDILALLLPQVPT